jgi:hypothetical protein
MSWDVYFCKFGETYINAESIPNNAEPLVLGSLEEIHLAVSRVFEDTDWTDSSWGNWESPHGSIEFNIGSDLEVDSFMLHVRASDSVVAKIVELAKQNGWQALDCSTGAMLEQSENPEAGLQGWRNYRDQILNKTKEQPKS